MDNSSDPFRLERFIEAQARNYADEARAYLAHPVLGPRLAATTRAVLGHPHRTLLDILGSPDDMKFCSSMTLFADICAGASFETLTAWAPQDDAGGGLFQRALATFCGGVPDERTLALLARMEPRR